jgi:hypothetical protein
MSKIMCISESVMKSAAITSVLIGRDHLDRSLGANLLKYILDDIIHSNRSFRQRSGSNFVAPSLEDYFVFWRISM